MTCLICRLCGSEVRETFCDLGMSPISNAFVRRDSALNMEPFYPLHALVCGDCLLVQLGEFQTPADIFSDEYVYFSSYSQSWLEHARRYALMMIERFGIGPASRVVEIASNDGYLLQYFRERQVPVLGIEPTANTAAVAMAKGIPTRVSFFGTETAGLLRSEGLQADLLVGNNVLAHVPDLHDFVGGMKIALKPGGVITMEFPHLLRLIEQNQFDTIYHEHFSYLSWHAVERLFAMHRITLFDVEELPTHGGSLRIFGRHAEDDSRAVTPRVAAMRHLEEAAGLTRMDTYRQFQEHAHAVKRDLLEFLIGARKRGERVVGYGAPAKGNTLLNYCGIRTDLIDYVVDRSPHKQDALLPGVRIPVHAPERIFETRPEYLLILPWNLRSEIIEQMRGIREWGGRFVVPLPGIEVIP